MEVSVDGLGLLGVDDGFERGGVGFANGVERAEVLEQASAGEIADAGDVEQFAVPVADLAALAVIGHGEAMSFIANLLDEMKRGRVAVEDDRVVLLSE
jgi:hypothetical protein